jgi:hypothetical protein
VVGTGYESLHLSPVALLIVRCCRLHGHVRLATAALRTCARYRGSRSGYPWVRSLVVTDCDVGSDIRQSDIWTVIKAIKVVVELDIEIEKTTRKMERLVANVFQSA